MKTGNSLCGLIPSYAIITGLWLFLMLPNCYAQIPPLRVGIFHFPPFLVVENDRTSGSELERLETVLKKAGISYTVDGYSVKRLYNNLDIGKVDLILAAKVSEEHKANIIASRKPITVLELRIYSLTDTKLSRNKQEWTGKSISVIRGFKYGGLIDLLNDMEKQNLININRANDHLDAFITLKNRRSDYVFDYKAPSSQVLKTLAIPGIKHITLQKIYIHVLINANLPNAEQILKKIEIGYEQMAERRSD